MGLFDQWNENKFSIYSRQEKTVLSLLESFFKEWFSPVLSKIDDTDLLAKDNESKKLTKEEFTTYKQDLQNELNINRKLSPNGDFTGTWNGVNMHSSEEGLASDWNTAKGSYGSVSLRLNNSDLLINDNTKHMSNKLDNGKTLLIAHRGAESVAPQNTIPSTEYAGMMGYYGCECDVQITSDKEWVVFHDDTVDALTNGTGTIASKTLTEVKALNIDYGPYITSRYIGTKIPTLREYLTVCTKWGMIPFIELKKYTNDDLPSFFSLLAEFNLLNKAIVMCNYTTIKYCKDNINQYFNALCLINPTTEEINNVAINIPNSLVGVPHTSITKEIVQQIINANLNCAVWTNGVDFQLLEDDFKKWGVKYAVGGII